MSEDRKKEDETGPEGAVEIEEEKLDQASGGADAGAGKVTVQDFSFTKKVDKSTPL
jgi:type VI protein secretion system component Hcp